MKTNEIEEGDLLYHAVHGLCRVEKLLKQRQEGKEVLCYALVPKIMTRMKTRFIIPAAGLEASGFHILVSRKRANEILDYLKNGECKEVSEAEVSPKTSSPALPHRTWDLAEVILSFSSGKFEAKDQRKRQMLERSVKGLVGELASVFNITPKEAAVKVQRSLGSSSKVNPSVLAALVHAGEN